MKILISENQLKNVVIPYFKESKLTKTKELKDIRESWLSLNEEEKTLVLELYKLTHPNIKQRLNEEEGEGWGTKLLNWTQTGLDIGGIFDPTGIADTINAVIYFSRGEILFGMLSLISIIPYVGDAVAKPIIIAAKAAGKEYKLFSAAVKTGKSAKIAETASTMKNTKFGKNIAGLLESFRKGMGTKIRTLLDKAKKVPVIKKYAKAIDGWIDVFEKAAKEVKIPTKGGFTMVGRGLSGPEKVDWSSVLKKIITPGADDVRLFRKLSKTGKLPNSSISNIYKNIMRVPETRKLMGRTKMFARFLDWLNVANFIGPEELSEKIPNADQKFVEFYNTPQGTAAFNEEVLPYITSQGETSSSYKPNIGTQTSSEYSGSEQKSNISIEQLASAFGLQGPLGVDTKMILSQLIKMA